MYIHKYNIILYTIYIKQIMNSSNGTTRDIDSIECIIRSVHLIDPTRFNQRTATIASPTAGCCCFTTCASGLPSAAQHAVLWD